MLLVLFSLLSSFGFQDAAAGVLGFVDLPANMLTPNASMSGSADSQVN
jgi:hypothetical protein